MIAQVLQNIARHMVTTALVLSCGLVPVSAQAQLPYPQLGFSAVADSHVDSVAIDVGETFTLYVNMFGPETGGPIDQDFASISWVVLSVCCGATLDVHDVQFNPAFDHSGGPYQGVLSTPVDGCIDEPMLNLATLTVTLDAPNPGEYLMSAGPFLNAADCTGGSPIVVDLPIRVVVSGEFTPNEARSWGALKSLYR